MDPISRVENISIEINSDEMQILQDAFCKANDMYAMCIGKNYGQITSFSGSKSEEDFVDSNFSPRLRRELRDSFVDGDAENIIERYGTEDYFMYRAVAIRGTTGELLGVWLCFGINNLVVPADVHLPTDVNRTTLDAFDKAISLLETLTKYYCAEKIKSAALNQKLSLESETQKDMEFRLRKNEIMTDILRLMESEKSFANVSKDILKEAGLYIECTNVALMQMRPDGRYVDMVSEWYDTPDNSLTSYCQDISVDYLPFMNGKPYTISSDTELPDSFNEYFTKYGISAGIFLPITVNSTSAMYLCFLSVHRIRKWTMEEVRFANDVKRIIHTVLVKKITKNSLASSYNALEAILQNAGYGVAVSDVANKQLLYTNDSFTHMFSDEVDRLAIEEILFDKRYVLSEFNGYSANGSGRWYDINFATIQWVDGREVRLTTFYDVTDLRAYQKRIEKQANEDILTGLYNRQACEKDLSAEYRFTIKAHKEFAVLMIDLDDFSNINEGLGHKTGDELLKYIASSLNGISQITDKVYRVGGDEFAIIVSHDIYDDLELIVKRIMNLFDNPWIIDDNQYYCTMSMGGLKSSDVDNVSSILTRLNIALHGAKDKGKNRFQFYDKNTDVIAAEKLNMEQSLRKAVEDSCKEFEVYYQPIMEMVDGVTVCCGAEALTRWNSKSMGMIMPDDFIGVAESIGIINEIGEKVLLDATKACKRWNDLGHPEYKINVNLSVVQLIRKDIVDLIRNALETTAIDPRNLTLEVTESLAVNDIEKMVNILDEIRALGCRVALDDFGTGYSSLSYIKQMPIDTIKIDRCFVQDVDSDGFSEAFVKTVSELADSLDIDVCVEGVEQNNQLDMISRFSVNLAQGFLFDEPLTRAEFESKYL